MPGIKNQRAWALNFVLTDSALLELSDCGLGVEPDLDLYRGVSPLGPVATPPKREGHWGMDHTLSLATQAAGLQDG
jgi:hypothetical protein